MRETEQPGEREPTKEEIEAASSAVRSIVENHADYAGDDGTVTETSSPDGSHSRKQLERQTHNGYLSARQQWDWDETLLEPQQVETLHALARLGSGFAEATFTISRGQLMYAAYTDRQDPSKTVDGVSGPALEAAYLAFTILADTMKEN